MLINNKFVGVLVLFFLWMPYLLMAGQSDSLSAKKGEFALVGYAGVGCSYYFSAVGVPPGSEASVHKVFPDATVRVMWHPDHLLRLGLESGYLTYYSYSFIDKKGNPAQVLLSGVPLMVVFSMPLAKRFNIFAGLGTFLMTTHLDYLQRVKSSTLNIGWSLAVNYIQPITKNVGLGAEAKLLRSEETSDSVISLQVQMVYKFLRW